MRRLVLLVVAFVVAFPSIAAAYYVKHPGGSWSYAVVLSRPGYKPSMRSMEISAETSQSPAVFIDENAFLPSGTINGTIAYMVPPAVPSAGYYSSCGDEVPGFSGSVCPTTTGAKGGYAALFIDHVQTFQPMDTWTYFADGLGFDHGRKNEVTSGASGCYERAGWGPFTSTGNFSSYSPSPSRITTVTPTEKYKAECWMGLMLVGSRNMDGGMTNRWVSDVAVHDPQGNHVNLPAKGQRLLWQSVDQSAPVSWVSYMQSGTSIPVAFGVAPLGMTHKYLWSVSRMQVQAVSELNTECAQALYGRVDMDLYESTISSAVVPASAAGGIAGVSKEESGTVPSEITSSSIPSELGLPSWLSMWANDKILKPVREMSAQVSGVFLWPFNLLQDVFGGGA